MGNSHQHLRLGIIGLSEGNGHPFSWAAICNGYNKDAMEACGFPVIPDYLAKQQYPDDFLTGVSVTHVWTEDESTSQRIASASRIGKICHTPGEMIGEVDGILLARDDAENHFRYAAPFLKSGLPVYIDKPFALSRSDALRLRSECLHPSQIYTCSALYFARELQIPLQKFKEIGPLRSIYAITPKNWETYGVHLLDPVLRQLGDQTTPAETSGWCQGPATHLMVRWTSGVSAHFHATGLPNCAIRIHYVGQSGEFMTIFQDSFTAFRNSLEAFLTQIRLKEAMIPLNHVDQVVDLLEAGTKLRKTQ